MANALLENAYIFNRDYKSSIRLTYNHWLITQLSGYLLHPKIPSSPAGLHVADIGTGTGIWLIDLAKTLPASSSLDGFDISSAQYPPPAWLPPNVRLHTHDAFAPYPKEFHGKYDVVNMRFLITVLTESNVHGLMQSAMALLKPGGYLQWLDLDPLTARAVSLDPREPLEQTERLAALMRQSGAGVSQDLRINGLETIVQDRIGMQDCYRMFWGQSHLMGYEEFWVKKLNASGGGVEHIREGTDTIEELQRELRLGVSLDTEWFCVVARSS